MVHTTNEGLGRFVLSDDCLVLCLCRDTLLGSQGKLDQALGSSRDIDMHPRLALPFIDQESVCFDLDRP